MARAGQAFRQHGVATILLVHGTFVGTDAAGMAGLLARLWPAAGDRLRGWLKSAVDQLVAEDGNFTSDYARLLEDCLNPSGTRPIRVRRFSWSSENFHLGRAHAAVTLIDELSRLCQASHRAMLWGHSHAGNVFAILSNLLAADERSLEQFFEAGQPYYRWPLGGPVDLPAWPRVRALLRQRKGGELARNLDLVTLGTPIRYGWDTGGFARLLHFVHHRPVAHLAVDQGEFPPALADVMAATRGDYVQQLGIAGTDVPPSPLYLRSWIANRRLGQLLERSLEPPALLDRLAQGRLVARDGQTLLVDYRHDTPELAEEVAGHAVYTHREWMLFHAEQTATWFYAEQR